MARKHPLKCAVGTKRFTVIRVNGNGFDSYAGRSFESALRSAQPDRGARLDVFVVCARDAGEARLTTSYIKHGKLVKSIRYKRG
jgi:hypothetical protein